MDVEKNKAIFKTLVSNYIKREGVKELMDMLEETDFFTAPASTRFHGAEEGGLCAHSICVGKQLSALAKLYAPDAYSQESLTLVSLFHDLCKVGCYKVEMRNAKNEAGQWEKVPFYKFDEDFAFGGHGSKSVFLLMEYVSLSREEAVAINTHMGFANCDNITAVSSAYEDNLLAWMLHVADEAATYIDKM